MPAVRPRPSGLLALLSLPGCVVVASLIWSPQNQVETYFHRTPGGKYYSVTLYPGRIAFERSKTATLARLPGDDSQPPAFVAWGHSSGFTAGRPATNSAWNRIGFWYWPNSMRIVQANNELVQHETWVVPKWSLLLAPTLPACAVIAARLYRRRRRKRGTCRECGYDLRATPGRCPECGTVAAPAAPLV